jgi:hypothetical protein
MQLGGRLSDKSVFDLFICLSYLDRADAEAYKQSLIQQALENGGSIYSEEGDYTTITGKIILKPTGITHNNVNKHYRIGVETEATKFSILPFKSKASIPSYKTTDGLAYEVKVDELRQRKIRELHAKQDEASQNLKKFTAEIKPMTDLCSVLRSFVRYSNQRTDKEKLAAVAIKKIQELSKI